MKAYILFLLIFVFGQNAVADDCWKLFVYIDDDNVSKINEIIKANPECLKEQAIKANEVDGFNYFTYSSFHKKTQFFEAISDKLSSPILLLTTDEKGRSIYSILQNSLSEDPSNIDLLEILWNFGLRNEKDEVIKYNIADLYWDHGDENLIIEKTIRKNVIPAQLQSFPLELALFYKGYTTALKVYLEATGFWLDKFYYALRTPLTYDDDKNGIPKGLTIYNKYLFEVIIEDIVFKSGDNQIYRDLLLNQLLTNWQEKMTVPILDRVLNGYTVGYLGGQELIRLVPLFVKYYPSIWAKVNKTEVTRKILFYRTFDFENSFSEGLEEDFKNGLLSKYQPPKFGEALSDLIKKLINEVSKLDDETREKLRNRIKEILLAFEKKGHIISYDFDLLVQELFAENKEGKRFLLDYLVRTYSSPSANGSCGYFALTFGEVMEVDDFKNLVGKYFKLEDCKWIELKDDTPLANSFDTHGSPWTLVNSDIVKNLASALFSLDRSYFISFITQLLYSGGDKGMSEIGQELAEAYSDEFSLSFLNFKVIEFSTELSRWNMHHRDDFYVTYAARFFPRKIRPEGVNSSHKKKLTYLFDFALSLPIPENLTREENLSYVRSLYFFGDKATQEAEERYKIYKKWLDWPTKQEAIEYGCLATGVHRKVIDIASKKFQESELPEVLGPRYSCKSEPYYNNDWKELVKDQKNDCKYYGTVEGDTVIQKPYCL